MFNEKLVLYLELYIFHIKTFCYEEVLSYPILSYPKFNFRIITSFIFLILYLTPCLKAQIDPCERPGNILEIFARPDGQPTVYTIPTSIYRNIIVRTGGHLIIQTTISMGDDNRIEVERGAKLEVIDGTITNACTGLLWRGIFVHGNTEREQPDPSLNPINPADPLNVLDPEDSGIVFLRRCTLEYADAAIRTDVLNPPFNAFREARWGGLIDAEDCTFVNNRVGVGFMRYEKENKSQFINCIFEETDDQAFPLNGTHGVLIWRCQNILFERSKFRDLDIVGIYSEDAGYIVRTQNEFSDMPTGIRAIASTPMAPRIDIIGGDANCSFPPELRNLFIGNDVHISIRGGGDVFRYRIVNNTFFGGNFGVQASFLSNTLISRNFFSAIKVPINFNNTFGSPAVATCNEIKGGCTGVLVRGVNLEIDNFGQKGFLFDGNRYRQFTGTGMKLTEFNEFGLDWPGIIPDQGSPFSAALNCFSPDNLAEIETIGANTEEFTYYKPFASTTNCFDVQYYNTQNNTNNFFIERRFALVDPCGIIQKTPPTLTALQEKRDSMNYWKAYLVDSPDNKQYQAYYQTHLNKKEDLLRQLIELDLANNLYDQAESLLLEESTERQLKWGYNIRLLAKDYVGAAAKLNQLNTTDLENYNFVKTQEVVLAVETANTEFTLTPQQVSELTIIANDLGKNSGYAMTLLERYSQNYEAPPFDKCSTTDCNCVIELREDIDAATIPHLDNRYKIYPNPAIKVLNIEYNSPNDKVKIVRIFSIEGKLISSFTVNESGLRTIDVEAFPPGIYLINVEENGKTMFQDKFIVARY